MTADLVRLDIRRPPAADRPSAPAGLSAPDRPSAPATTGVAVITLDDPSRRNVLSPRMVGDLVAAFDAVEDDNTVGAVVVTGAPPAFCAGGDLGGLAAVGNEADDDGGRRELRGIYEGFLRVGRCPLPTVAAVNGPAVGAGMNLALACDVRIAGRSARFEARFLDLGLHPGGGHTFMLSRAAGAQVTAAMVLFGERLDGMAAAEHGVVYACVDDDHLVDEAVRIAGRAASVPPALARRAKQTLRDVAAVDDQDDAVTIELDAQLWSIREPFFAERLAEMQARISGGRPATPQARPDGPAW